MPPKLSLASFAIWLHSLLWYSFDLLGGPELVQLFLRQATETRRLAGNEITVATEILGPKAIRYQDVRIAQGGILQTVFRLNGNRAFATWHTINMPDSRGADLPLLVHELTHTFQYERVGSVYIGQGLWVQARLSRKAYDYGGPAGLKDSWAAGKRYKDYNREQQGQIAQDYCSRIRSEQDTTAYEPFIAELRKGLI
ncbi:MAG: hypothetical protein PVH03_05845 [Chloroflexota bacterium]|jgi:hypothetical protein